MPGTDGEENEGKGGDKQTAENLLAR